MKRVLYEKVGGRYRPVVENFDDHYTFSRGNHLVMCYPGGESRVYHIDPNHAALIAAGRTARDAMCDAIGRASELKPCRTPVTEGQRRAWNKLAREFGDELATLNGPSARDIADAGLQALQAEADKLMQHESVRNAYNQFLLVCELTKKENA